MNTHSIPGSVSRWLADPTSDGYPCGAQLLWQRFGLRLVRLARRQLRDTQDPSYDAEDLALSTIHAFHRHATGNRFSRPANREQLWNLLATISLNKAKNFRRSLARLKRRRPLASSDDPQAQVQQIPDTPANSPEWVAIIAEQCEFLLGLLDEHDAKGELRQIALMRLDGATKSQIASTLGYTRFTIAARINLIQTIWRHHLKRQSG